MAKRLPKEILVFQCDEAEGQPVYAVASNVDEISEEYDGATVGVYVLSTQNVFSVRRALKAK